MKKIITLLKHFLYYRHRYAWAARIIPKNLQGEQKKWLGELARNGIVVMPDYFTKEDVDIIVSEIENALVTEKYSKLIDLPEYGVQRYILSSDSSQTANNKVFNEFFDELGRSYLGGLGKRFQVMYEIKGGENAKSIADDMHFDDWKKRFKIFVYLNDVSENNCPFHFYPNSKGNSLSRFIKECEYVLWGRHGSWGYYSKREEERLIQEKEIVPLTVTGKKGTVILCDTSHLHRGTPSIDGSQRQLLGAYYALR